MNSIKISIPSLIENIKIIESFIDNAREKFEINDDIYGNIMISVTECISNAIIHGNQSNKNKLVHLELKAEEDQLQFIIEDEGEGFDLEQLPDPTSPENIAKPGGRGIFLIRHLTDEVKFEENGKKTILSFYMD
ncbi:MAG TPA: ATP-binding protein [Algoriphagus sp.]|jgi:serine/threonine-protein kinase RsbW|uniref:Serine/threonine-protein kinase RsbW n=1 Tax=Algoriphagus ornithinivorans TaxID=226506 RepID=A0A1I5G2E1_9BACT|nr:MULTISPECIES: ATP-binding protein [Algoriphagus]MAL12117.1 ATP-binding protein [Algoriphagus sp.]MAN87032.1 ATP-binding protein [Algoriphagus sp.]QYH40491.1 ATP-binding protein [Algoriphagus sp. NBT04N3]SFO29751.1 serine/threonine-protein kinase RsbW [Algoriphagus ornithinivorans]HAH38770.1 ATP-binding protein [Algoriphagus sp.]|tara:strand:- start:1515 stop:1916 length:402 start_codon:yes stop_codon:yes gene_type:complete